MTFLFCSVVFGFFTWLCRSTAVAAAGSGLVSQGRGVEESREGITRAGSLHQHPLPCCVTVQHPCAGKNLALLVGSAVLLFNFFKFFF